MKKFLALIFSSALILGACGNDDTSNNNSDTKSERKTEKKSEDKKSKEEKKHQENEDSKSAQKDNSTEEQNTQETATNEQTQSQQQTQQPATQEQPQAQQNGEYDSTKHSDEYNASHPVSTDDDWTPEMIEENERLNKEIEANAKVAKENGYTGIPNGDVGGVPTPDEYYSNDQLDPDTGLPMEDVVPHDVE
ncbi:hypothetical protein [Staphylococcus hominis]|uniref:hypothetical protein n=1 Tax=Staphylococcus hominis TaxID=1290 RepID=UPI0011A47344|nr:hypothetical protein [Staphylococcus hominis]